MADCDQIGNKGAYIIFKADCKPDIRTFEAVPHPKARQRAVIIGFFC